MANKTKQRDKDYYLIEGDETAEFFVCNSNSYASTTLTLEELKKFRKDITETIIRMMRNEETE